MVEWGFCLIGKVVRFGYCRWHNGVMSTDKVRGKSLLGGKINIMGKKRERGFTWRLNFYCGRC